jgi:cold shock CspA family protein
MNGKIKFIDHRTGQWGYVVPDDGSPDVHFNMSDVEGPRPTEVDEGAPVEFDRLVQEGPRRHAQRVRLVNAPRAQAAPARLNAPARDMWLRSWAFLPDFPFRNKDGKDYSSVLEYLAYLALEERWYFGTEPDPRDPYPILDNYLTYTYVKLRHEQKISERGNREAGWACFNTGLVDKLYDPIYALFEQNDRGPEPWRFYDFCVPGKRNSGRKLTEVFDPLPEPAKYFNSNFDMLFDSSKEIHVDYDHVIVDGVRRESFSHGFSSRARARNV